MRIIGGKYKGKVLKAPLDLPVRPTTDYAKTGLFNILTNRFDFTVCSVLDLFAGTGSISLEFVSRYIDQITAVDNSSKCIQYIDKHKRQYDLKNLRVIKSEVLNFLSNDKSSYHIIFADPPYDYPDKLKLIELVFQHHHLKEDGIFVLEHKTGEEFSMVQGFLFSRTYGNVSFSFFHNFE